MTRFADAEPIIYVIDDDDGMLRALDALLYTIGYKTAVFSRPRDFLSHFNDDAHGCLLLDIRMPEMSGLELQQRLNRMGAILPIIFITGYGDVPMAVQAMKDGALEFLQKPVRNQDLLDHVNHALTEDSRTRLTMARRAEATQRLGSLTVRERQVMDFVVNGAANKVIAIDLSMSERTVEVHRAKVMEKLGARSVAHLVKLHMTLAGEHP